MNNTGELSSEDLVMCKPQVDLTQAYKELASGHQQQIIPRRCVGRTFLETGKEYILQQAFVCGLHLKQQTVVCVSHSNQDQIIANPGLQTKLRSELDCLDVI